VESGGDKVNLALLRQLAHEKNCSPEIRRYYQLIWIASLLALDRRADPRPRYWIRRGRLRPSANAFVIHYAGPTLDSHDVEIFINLGHKKWLTLTSMPAEDAGQIPGSPAATSNLKFDAARVQGFAVKPGGLMVSFSQRFRSRNHPKRVSSDTKS